MATIKEKEDVDMIVCLSHSGTSEDPKKSEDELLAKAVPELDVIISGHTHTTLEEPIIQEILQLFLPESMESMLEPCI